MEICLWPVPYNIYVGVWDVEACDHMGQWDNPTLNSDHHKYMDVCLSVSFLFICEKLWSLFFLKNSVRTTILTNECNNVYECLSKLVNYTLYSALWAGPCQEKEYKNGPKHASTTISQLTGLQLAFVGSHFSNMSCHLLCKYKAEIWIKTLDYYYYFRE